MLQKKCEFNHWELSDCPRTFRDSPYKPINCVNIIKSLRTKYQTLSENLYT